MSQSEELRDALQHADSLDEVAIAFSVGLEAAYTSHPRDGANAAIAFLRSRVEFRAKLKAEGEAEVARQDAEAAAKAEAERLAAEAAALNKADA